MDLFDEIIKSLKYEAELSDLTYISPGVLGEFNRTLTDKPVKNISRSAMRRDSKPSSQLTGEQKFHARNLPGNNCDNRVPQQASAKSSSDIPSREIKDRNVLFASNPIQAKKMLEDYSSLDFEQLKSVVGQCNKCRLCESRTNVVFGEGSTNTDFMLIGEGPNKDEDEQGRPFVEKSGQLLTKMLKAMGFERSDVFITNIVKCRPPQNRDPSPDEAEICLPFLLRQIQIIKPKVILLLGAVPLKYILKKAGITRLHGEWHEFMGIKTLPTFHPAYLLWDPQQKKYAWNDLQKAMKVLGKEYNSVK